MSVMMGDQPRHFPQSLGDGALCCFLISIHTAKCVLLLPCQLSDNPHDIYKVDNWNRELANKDESATKKQKVTSKSSLSDIVEEIAHPRNVDTAV